MKKLFVIAFTFFALAIIAIYIFIPTKLQISKIEYVDSNINPAYRILSNKVIWEKWWPKDTGKAGNRNKTLAPTFFYKGFTYKVSKIYYDAVKVVMNTRHSIIESRISLIKLNIDSVAIIWNCKLKTGMNPISKLFKYNEAEKIKNNMAEILFHLRLFLENERNIYGVNFHVVMSKDSTMVLTKKISKNYPTTGEIYQLVTSLKDYIKSQGAKDDNYPMLHVKILPDSGYESMVAIPVNKELPGNNKISFSRFIPWKVLTAEVKGGNRSVNEALQQMKVYISDYQKTPMAIPFESLITDRSREPDTSKWVTKIYTPVP